MFLSSGGRRLFSLSVRTSRPDEQSELAERLWPLLGATTAALAGTSDYRGALSALARLVVPSLAHWCVIHVREGTATIQQLASVHADPASSRALRDIGHRFVLADEKVGIARVLAEGEPMIVPTLQPEEATDLLGLSAVDGRRAGVDFAALGTTSLVVIPLPLGADAAGTLTCARDDASPGFSPADVGLLSALCIHAAPTLEFARRASIEAQARADADAARQHVTSSLDELPDAFFSLDAESRITYLNPAAARTFDLSRPNALGRVLWDLLPTGMVRPVSAQCVRAMHDGVTSETDLHLESQSRWLSVRTVPTRVGVSLYVRDVTQRHVADAERERLLAEAGSARAAAEQANQAKTDFLASMSHELRTPLNAILGYVAIISDGISGPVSPSQFHQLGRVRASSNHLLALIEEVLSFARLESGAESARIEITDAIALARESAALVEPTVEAHGLRFTIPDADGAVPMRTDARKVRQILLNLLANAARFTSPGGEVSLRVTAEGEWVSFEVRDTGAGIAADHHERIFEPFWQVEQKLTRRLGGTGLGLSVSRRLARLLGGEVTVKSTVGVGSSFTVRLPRVPVAAHGEELAEGPG